MRRFCAVAVVTATLAGAVPAVSQEPSFITASELQQAGKLEAAAGEYRRFLAAHPANVEAQSNLGVVLVQLGRYAEAIAAYRAALAVAPANATVRFNLGLAFYKSERLGDAADAFMQVLTAQPANLRARYLAADCQLRRGRPGDVIALLAPLEGSRADDPALAYLLGMAYLTTKQAGKGQVLIDRIMRRGDSAQAHVMMAMAKRSAGDLNGAADDLKQAVTRDPNLPGVHALYGKVLLETGNPDPARVEFEAELLRNPLDFDANLYMGILLRAEEQFDAALDHLTRALGVRPGDGATRFQIASLALARQNTAEAARMLEAIVKESPSFAEAHVALATAYYRMQRKADGDRERAVAEHLNRERDAKERGRTAASTTSR